jgi:CubicO group peptidase (beta-lactamase class C family)
VAADLPWFAIKSEHTEGLPVTVRHLITHTSGLPREAAFPSDSGGLSILKKWLSPWTSTTGFRNARASF